MAAGSTGDPPGSVAEEEEEEAEIEAAVAGVGELTDRLSDFLRFTIEERRRRPEDSSLEAEFERWREWSAEGEKAEGEEERGCRSV